MTTPAATDAPATLLSRLRAASVAVALVALLGSLGGAFAQSAESFDQQLATALQHVGFSINADNVGGTTTHLGHVLNCIAGEGGEGFNGDWGHPCGGQGSGLLSDLAAHPQAAALAAVLDAAHRLAMVGVEAGDHDAARAAAAGVQGLLQAIADF